MKKLSIFIAFLMVTATAQADHAKPTWCNKAKSYPELAVCSDGDLSESAIALENRWKSYQKNHTESEINLVKINLNDWNVESLQKCESKDCIRTAYSNVQGENWYKNTNTETPSWDNNDGKTDSPGKQGDKPIDKSDDIGLQLKKEKEWLNAIYKQLYDAYYAKNQQLAKNLESKQKSWLETRNTTCEPEAEGQKEDQTCLLKMTKERADELNQEFNMLRGNKTSSIPSASVASAITSNAIKADTTNTSESDELKSSKSNSEPKNCYDVAQSKGLGNANIDMQYNPFDESSKPVIVFGELKVIDNKTLYVQYGNSSVVLNTDNSPTYFEKSKLSIGSYVRAYGIKNGKVEVKMVLGNHSIVPKVDVVCLEPFLRN